MEIVEKQCLDAFGCGDKEQALRILPKVRKPHTIRDIDDRTLLHGAAYYGWEDIFLLLVQKYHCDPGVTNSIGENPLHYACMGHRLSLIAFLLSTTSLRLTDKDKNGYTPFDRLNKHYAILSKVASLIDWSTEFSVSSSFKIFMTGNTAAGKSSLTRLIEELAGPAPSKPGLVSGVKPLTAGVHITQCPW